ncbi:pyridoxamine 5'-phosphate oxidase family protein [Roseivivax sp. CAU 1753]
MSTELKDAFWSRMDDVQAGLLTASGTRPIPMSPNADRAENAIWFITARGSAADDGAKANGDAAFYVADAKANLYATVDGTLSVSHDSAKLDEIWNVVAAAWFEDGRDDDAIQLVKFTPREAEIWATTNAAGFLYEIAKANLTDDTADAGDHGRVTF